MTNPEDGAATDADDTATPGDRDDRSDPGDNDDGVATGILAAEGRARDVISRRRRLLVGGAVLGLVIAGAVLVVMAVLQQRANTEAELAADRAEARSSFAEDVVDRAEAYEPPAAAARRDAGELRATLEQLLTETTSTDDELSQQADGLAGRLQQAATRIEELTELDLPEPPELVAADPALAVLQELEVLRTEASALSEEIPQALTDVELWTEMVVDVNRALADHVAQVESEEPTSDPSELAEQWRDERPALRRLATAATAAREVPGLEDWAAAHATYAEGVLAWIDEAVRLLEDRELDTYNERFEELFSDDDPFDLDASVAAATERALSSDALLQLGTLQERATLVLDAVDRTEVTAGRRLDDDAA